MDLIEFSGKTVDDAITEACEKLEVTSDKLYYEVIEKGTSGILGFGSKPAVIKACVKSEDDAISNDVKEFTEDKKEVKVEKAVSETVNENDKSNEAANKEEEKAPFVLTDKNDPKVFLSKVFEAMNLKASIKSEVVGNEIDIELSGDDMGVLIGKRGQTLDSLQYLTSLYVNKGSDTYVRVKIDTENYRSRRKDTLENLAKNIAYKVKRTKKSVSLEPMNPYERRIIHSALQNDKYVSTHSEGEEPFRKVIITYNR